MIYDMKKNYMTRVEDYETEELEFFNDLLNGISFSINFGMEQLAAQGTIMRKLADYTDDDDSDHFVDFGLIQVSEKTEED